MGPAVADERPSGQPQRPSNRGDSPEMHLEIITVDGVEGVQLARLQTQVFLEVLEWLAHKQYKPGGKADG